MSDALAALSRIQMQNEAGGGGGGSIGATGAGGGEGGGGKGIDGVTNSATVGFPIWMATNGAVNLKNVEQFGINKINHGILTTKANAFGLPERQSNFMARAHANLIQGIKDTAEKNFSGVGGGPSISAPSGDSGPSMGGGGGSGISAPVIAALSGVGGLGGISGGEHVSEISAPPPVPSSGGGRNVESMGV